MLRTRVLRAAALVGIAASAWAQNAEDGVIVIDEGDRVIQVRPRSDIDEKALIDDTEGNVMKVTVNTNKRWIGIGCGSVGDTLRAHVDLPEGQGVVVQLVVPDSPAEKAGLQLHDILLEAGQTPLSSVEDLVVAIGQAEDQPLEVTWLRKGERMTKQIVPELRPPAHEVDESENAQAVEGPGDLDNIRMWIERLEKGVGPAGGNLRFKILGPGLEVADGMPEDLSIQIQRQGDNPAEIKVERGDSTWELTENELGELPDDVRPHVERMLGGGKAGMFLPRQMEKLKKRDGLPNIDDLEIDVPWPKMEEKFEEMNRRMEEMMERIEQLRSQEDPPEDDSNDA